jgi:hypothetical protein
MMTGVKDPYWKIGGRFLVLDFPSKKGLIEGGYFFDIVSSDLDPIKSVGHINLPGVLRLMFLFPVPSFWMQAANPGEPSGCQS